MIINRSNLQWRIQKIHLDGEECLYVLAEDHQGPIIEDWGCLLYKYRKIQEGGGGGGGAGNGSK